MAIPEPTGLAPRPRAVMGAKLRRKQRPYTGVRARAQCWPRRGIEAAIPTPRYVMANVSKPT